MKSTDQKKAFRADTESVIKLTRSAQRKLMVTSIAVAAAALILLGAGMGYLNRHNSGSENLPFEEMEDSLKAQLREEMEEAAAYLEKLDSSIAENQRKLEAACEQLATGQEALLTAVTEQKKQEESASDMAANMKELEKKTETKINALQRNMDSARTDIRSALNRIPSIIAAFEESGEKRKVSSERSVTEFFEAGEAFLEISQSIYKVETNLKQSHENLSALLKELKSSEEKNQLELIQELSDVETGLEELLEADMELIMEAFAGLTSELQEQVAGLGQLMDGEFEALDQNLYSSFTSLDQNMGESFAVLGENMSGGFVGLDQNMSGGFTGLDENISESFAVLDQNMSSGFTGLEQGTADRIESLDQNMNGSFAELGQKVDDRFWELDQTVFMQYEELLKSSEQNSAELMDCLDALYSALRQELELVFTYVSDGKRELASALLTKGVTVDEDATFAQIRDAILRIEQDWTGSTEAVSYEYRYDEDAVAEYPYAEPTESEAGENDAAEENSGEEENGEEEENGAVEGNEGIKEGTDAEEAQADADE